MDTAALKMKAGEFAARLAIERTKKGTKVSLGISLGVTITLSILLNLVGKYVLNIFTL